MYKNMTAVPELPQLDYNEWWGPNESQSDSISTAVIPYRIVFSEAMIVDLQYRMEEYRKFVKPKTFTDAGWTYGVNSEAFAAFFADWVFRYKFIERERFLNKFDHFKTNIQGLDIHFMHVKPKVEKNVKVLPLLLLHGWPGSVREFYNAFPLLTTVRPGCDFVFEVIAPSLPGFGFSDATTRQGLSATKIAVILRNLMKRLGHDQFYVQGGDFGHIIGSSMATLFPKEVIGFHTNLPYVKSSLSVLVWILGGLWPSLVEKEFTDRLYPVNDKVEFFLEESGYFHMHSTKPDTLGIALHESPAGLAAYILEKFVLATTKEGKYKQDGGIEGVFSNEDLLDNIMMYWVPGTITTSMRLYKEMAVNSKLEAAINLIPTDVPTWSLRLKHEIFFTPEFILRWKYPNLLGTTTLEEGGHFAAFEKPVIFSDDIFKAVKQFQEFHKTR
ncbi:juvenile hormone epoxide hydrolase-like [Ostrinia furnacalis]|uniref:juvenile hormone epoxide hydrolase-like n=1 Tax=Ostrinia furnacalis TaxID=93504 RepID=UPI00103B7DB9|nr:juvenile hormone epoxide hydrolase-like [Ostrinia furnacalis]